MAVLCFFFFAGDRLGDKVQLPDHGIRALPYQPFGEVAVAEAVVLTQRFRATLQPAGIFAWKRQANSLGSRRFLVF